MKTPDAQVETDLTPLFAPQSIAVVGASSDLSKPGGRCVAFLREFGYSGRIYPVNPVRDEIAGLKTYRDVANIPELVDLVILLIDAATVPSALESAARARARSAIVCSSGFAELGQRGAALENELSRLSTHYGIPVMGPNSLGFIDVEARLPATFSTALQLDVQPLPGSTVLVSQSGAMGAAIFGVGQTLRTVGVGAFISTGNEAALRFSQVVLHVCADDRFKVVLGYIEGVFDGRELVGAIRIARERGRDVVVLKVGRSDAGKLAARSHTGSLAGNDEAWDAALGRAGALRAFSPEELLDIGMVLQIPFRPRGPKLGVVTMSGGAGVLIADAAADLGLELAALTEETKHRMRQLLKGIPAVENPLDFGALYNDAGAIVAAVRAMAESDETDLVVVFLGLSPKLVGGIEAQLAEIAAAVNKPLIVAWLGGPEAGRRNLNKLGIPVYSDPIRAVRAAAVLVRSTHAPRTNLPQPELPTTLSRRLRALRESGERELSERETKSLIAEYGIKVVPERWANSREEAARVAGQLTGSLAVKAEAPTVLHKSDIGAVRLGVELDEVADSFDAVIAAARGTGAAVNGASVQQMAPAGGVELLMGVRWDDQFGPLILVGAGGVASEVIQDIQIDLAPVDVERATELIMGLRMSAILGSFRGAPPRDIRAAAKALSALSHLAADAGSALKELDINPITVYDTGNGCLALDAAAVLGDL
jgi:acyl-CoA synthetase (NDP forming)